MYIKKKKGGERKKQRNINPWCGILHDKVLFERLMYIRRVVYTQTYTNTKIFVPFWFAL